MNLNITTIVNEAKYNFVKLQNQDDYLVEKKGTGTRVIISVK